MKRFKKLTMILLAIFTLSMFAGVTASAANTNIKFNDENLERCVRSALNKPTGDIFPEDMKTLTTLDASNAGIRDLSGIEYAVNLTDLLLNNNEITNIGNLSGLTNLEYISLDDNQVENISALVGLTNLKNLQINNNKASDISPLNNLKSLMWLGIGYNGISNINPLSGLKKLISLSLDGNPIKDISPISNLNGLLNLDLRFIEVSSLNPLASCTKLQSLNLIYNKISDISALSGLINLQHLTLVNNEISDITPIVTIANNGGFRSSGEIDIRNNKVDVSEGSQTYNNIMGLIDKGIRVSYDGGIIKKRVTKVYINYKELTIGTGEKFKLMASVFPIDAVDQNVNWASNNTDILSITQDGEVTGLKEGEALITVTAEDGGYTEQCRVIVTGKSQIVSFPDKSLERAVRDQLQKPEGDITSVDMGKLTSLSINGDVKSLEGLEYAVNMQSFRLYYCSIDNYKPISGLKSLRELSLYECGVRDISFLGNLTNLEILALNENYIKDISPVTNLTKLTLLDLNINLITDISPVKNLTRLESIGLAGNQISDINALSTLTNLGGLELGNNKIQNISVISNLHNLISLGLDQNQITDIGALSGLKNLSTLGLSGNKVVDLKPLSNLTKISVLILNDNKVNDISVLANLVNLRVLNIGSNPVKSISAISNFQVLEQLNASSLGHVEWGLLLSLPNLKDLDISNNQISNIGSLANFTGLEKIDISNNDITDVSPLQNLIKLKSANLSNNKIKDIMPLGNLARIEILYLDNNNIEDIGPLENLKRLFWLHAEHNKIRDVSPLLRNYNNGGLRNDNSNGGNKIYLAYNDIDFSSGVSNLSNIEELQRNGIGVYYGPQNVYATGVSMISKWELNIGEKYKLSASVKPIDATNRILLWSSDRPDIVSVDKDGNIEGMKPGIAQITVTTAEGGFTAQCSVTVNNILQNKEIELKTPSVKLTAGESKKLEYTVLPPLSSMGVTWKSMDNTIVTVDNDGNIKGVKNGQTVILVATEDGRQTELCQIEVTSPEVHAQSIKLNIENANLSTTDGYNRIQLRALVSPDDTQNKDVEWASQNPEIASVGNDGLVIGKKAGTTIITAAAKDGGKTASCSVTVAPVSGIKLNTSKLSLNVGDNIILKSAISPSNAVVKDVKWSIVSGNSVTVSSTGKITAVKTGTCVIKVTTLDGGKTAACTITVNAKKKAKRK